MRCRSSVGHYCTGVYAALQHRAGNFQGRFAIAFLDAVLFAKLDALLEPFLFQFLCDSHKNLLVLR